MSISLLSEMIAAAALILVALPLSAAGAAAPAMGMANCDTKCGDIIVPYPFGMGPARCYHSTPGFNLTCVGNTSTHPRLLIGNTDGGTLQVKSFSLFESSVLVMRTPGDIRVDADSSSSGSLFGAGLGPYIMLSPGSSGGGNELILLGCNVRATLKHGNITMSACSSLCDEDSDPAPLPLVFSRLESSMLCTGIGCCQAPIINHAPPAPGKKPAAAVTYHVELQWFGRNRSADEERMPAQVFVADDGWFEQKHDSNTLLLQPEDVAGGVPVWLNWVWEEVAADDPSSRSINSSHSLCGTDPGTPGGGYTCRCEQGYDGNPYITNGCQGSISCAQKFA